MRGGHRGTRGPRLGSKASVRIITAPASTLPHLPWAALPRPWWLRARWGTPWTCPRRRRAAQRTGHRCLRGQGVNGWVGPEVGGAGLGGVKGAGWAGEHKVCPDCCAGTAGACTLNQTRSNIPSVLHGCCEGAVCVLCKTRRRCFSVAPCAHHPSLPLLPICLPLPPSLPGV